MRISLALNGLKNISLPFIVLFLFAIKHRMFLWTGARFLKGLVTFLGPKANFKITTSRIASSCTVPSSQTNQSSFVK